MMAQLKLFEHDKVLHITVNKHNSALPDDVNSDVLVQPVGVTWVSDDEVLYPVEVDLGTQHSCTLEKGKNMQLQTQLMWKF